jgi:hypothetical protein
MTQGPFTDPILALQEWLTVAHTTWAEMESTWQDIDRHTGLGIINAVDVAAAGLEGAAISVGIDSLYQAIKIGGAYSRGEQNLTQEELVKVLDVLLNSLRNGFVRGTVTKTVLDLTGSSLLAALGFTVCVDVVPAIFKAVNHELTIDQALFDVGPKVFTSGVITIMVLTLPDLGKLLLGGAIAQAVWKEVPLTWKDAMTTATGEALSDLQIGAEALFREFTFGWS